MNYLTFLNIFIYFDFFVETPLIYSTFLNKFIYYVIFYVELRL